ncbi:hypothetical protein TrVFT333_001996 [Trichoderma virens FT-333]|nr:hypothetical protein TrVFT333_001996 [Trichoderma virens FT-333]
MAASGVKSISLAGAKRALRKWFRRGLPAGDSSDEEEVDEGQAVPPAPPNTPETSLLIEDSEEDNDSNAGDHQAEAAADTPDSDDSEYYQDFYNDSSTMSLNMFIPTVSSMPLAAAGVAQEHEEHEEHEEQQQPSDGKVEALTEQMTSVNVAHTDAKAEAIAEQMTSVNMVRTDDNVEALTQQMSNLNVARTDEGVAAVAKPISAPGDDGSIDFNDPAVLAERAMHLKFIGEALDMAKLALRTNETPVGCVVVHDNKVIARGMNATNVTRNGTRHAEFMALAALLSVAKPGVPKTTSLKPNFPPKKIVKGDGQSDTSSIESEWRRPDEGNEDGRKGHLYPYGQKELLQERVDGSILRESTLYVTVEPCVMCASLLRQVGIKKVYFGAVNDKFGGTGGPKSGGGSLGTSFPPGGGDGGNIERGFEIEGGWGRDEAVALLRRFYVQENGRGNVSPPLLIATSPPLQQFANSASSFSSCSTQEGRPGRSLGCHDGGGWTYPLPTDAAGNVVKKINDAKDAQDAAGSSVEGTTKENVEPRNTQSVDKGKEPLAGEGTL